MAKQMSTTEKIVAELNKATPATRAAIAEKVGCSVARVGEVVRACEEVGGKLVYSSARNTELKTRAAKAKAAAAKSAKKPAPVKKDVKVAKAVAAE
jgi:DNA-binding Lrp family transcriptional regulator